MLFLRRPKTQNPRIPFSGGTARADRTGKDPRMEHIAAVEERIVSDRLRRKLEEVNVAAREQLAPLQDHVNFTLQVSFFIVCNGIFPFALRPHDSGFMWKLVPTWEVVGWEFVISFCRKFGPFSLALLGLGG